MRCGMASAAAQASSFFISSGFHYTDMHLENFVYWNNKWCVQMKFDMQIVATNNDTIFHCSIFFSLNQ